MIVAAVEVEAVLLGLKVGFLILLYLFIWRIVRSVAKDLRLPQESFVLGPQQAAAAGLGRTHTGLLVVLASPALEPGTERELDSSAVTLGRSPENDLVLDSDEFASVQHARIEPRRDGVWVEDLESTNGTFVNGIKLTRPRKLASGDVIRVGETDLRYEL
ncbi:MAG TPA: FHA domain-containing protein [Gaiellaceae bacterium]|nr:FHA domain-containing protein [Gaiellaceae bacterium]